VLVHIDFIKKRYVILLFRYNYLFFYFLGELNPDRSKRKREQIENMISGIAPLIKTGDRIVEFCAGGGHLGIVIAYLRPDCNVCVPSSIFNLKSSI